jgi:hypothetical protein
MINTIKNSNYRVSFDYKKFWDKYDSIDESYKNIFKEHKITYNKTGKDIFKQL